MNAIYNHNNGTVGRFFVCYQPQGWSTCAAGPGAGAGGDLETSVFVPPLRNLWASKFFKKT